MKQEETDALLPVIASSCVVLAESYKRFIAAGLSHETALQLSSETLRVIIEVVMKEQAKKSPDLAAMMVALTKGGTA